MDAICVTPLDAGIEWPIAGSKGSLAEVSGYRATGEGGATVAVLRDATDSWLF